ncbi:hypothetical protein [uncultured Microscilla sp.]|uniref:hypothetical protein n=1 Tax=uncultured Microscilla sp. TaxID=432653 RepID=UPI002628164F|nr:hypothetical protein [uncultured Microscilla sp.]
MAISKDSSIKDLILLLVKGGDAITTGITVFEAEVMSVSKGDNTCVVKKMSSELEFEGIRLVSNTDSTEGNTVFYPQVGSIVSIVFDTGSLSGFVTATSQTEEVLLNGGENGGLVMVEILVSKLNVIEQKLNDFISEYKDHNHLHPQGPTTAFVKPSTLTSLDKTKQDDLENKKVKH